MPDTCDDGVHPREIDCTKHTWGEVQTHAGYRILVPVPVLVIELWFYIVEPEDVFILRSDTFWLLPVEPDYGII